MEPNTHRCSFCVALAERSFCGWHVDCLTVTVYDELIILSRNSLQVQGLQDDTDDDEGSAKGSEEQMMTNDSDKGTMVC